MTQYHLTKSERYKRRQEKRTCPINFVTEYYGIGVDVIPSSFTVCASHKGRRRWRVIRVKLLGLEARRWGRPRAVSGWSRGVRRVSHTKYSPYKLYDMKRGIETWFDEFASDWPK